MAPVREPPSQVRIQGATSGSLPREPSVVELVERWVTQGLEAGASDIHIEPLEDGLQVRFRIDGFLRIAASLPISYHAGVVARIKVLAGMDIAERRAPQDGRTHFTGGNRDVDLRVSVLPTVWGEKVVLRLFDRTVSLRKLESLGFDGDLLERYRGTISGPSGMILVTGPTGSGKTSTMLSSLAFLKDSTVNIVTVEDPVEYRLHGVNHVQVHPRTGLTFASGLKAVLRQDPDIIMVGEIRDMETAEVAVRAALTGHRVFSSLHTHDAAGALTRLMDLGVEPFLIASSVKAVVAQRLVRRLCPDCRGGCPQCGGSGYSGRVGIFEMLFLTQPLQELVMGRAATAEIRRCAEAQGMRPLLAAGMDCVERGITTKEEIWRVASPGDY